MTTSRLTPRARRSAARWHGQPRFAPSASTDPGRRAVHVGSPLRGSLDRQRVVVGRVRLEGLAGNGGARGKPAAAQQQCGDHRSSEELSAADLKGDGVAVDSRRGLHLGARGRVVGEKRLSAETKIVDKAAVPTSAIPAERGRNAAPVFIGL